MKASVIKETARIMYPCRRPIKHSSCEAAVQTVGTSLFGFYTGTCHSLENTLL
jgi:hypothetical protein